MDVNETFTITVTDGPETLTFDFLFVTEESGRENHAALRVIDPFHGRIALINVTRNDGLVGMAAGELNNKPIIVNVLVGVYGDIRSLLYTLRIAG